MTQEAYLDVRAIPLWLATVDLEDVGPEYRDKLVEFQAHCRDALFCHFYCDDPTDDEAVAEVLANPVHAVSKAQHDWELLRTMQRREAGGGQADDN